MLLPFCSTNAMELEAGEAAGIGVPDHDAVDHGWKVLRFDVIDLARCPPVELHAQLKSDVIARPL